MRDVMRRFFSIPTAVSMTMIWSIVGCGENKKAVSDAAALVDSGSVDAGVIDSGPIPADSGCFVMDASGEGSPGTPSCSDNMDNDCDGFTDLEDPSCTEWNIVEVDSMNMGGSNFGDARKNVLLIDSDGKIHWFYQATGTDELFYRKLESGVWSDREKIDGDVYQSLPDGGAALTNNKIVANFVSVIQNQKNGRLNVVYNVQVWNGINIRDLWFAERVGDTWETRVILGLEPPMLEMPLNYLPGLNSLAQTHDGTLFAVYHEAATAGHRKLFYSKSTDQGATWTGGPQPLGAPQPSMIDPEIISGRFSQTVVDSSDRIHIVYAQEYPADPPRPYNTRLKHAYSTDQGVTWTLEVVDESPGAMTDSLADTARWTSAAIDSTDTIHVAYWDRLNGNLKYIQCKNGCIGGSSSWTEPEIVDGEGVSPGVGQFCWLTLDLSGRPRIAYYDGTPRNLDLKFARRSAYGSWYKEVIDATDGAGVFPSVVIDQQGYYHITYRKNPPAAPTTVVPVMRYATNAPSH